MQKGFIELSGEEELRIAAIAGEATVLTNDLAMHVDDRCAAHPAVRVFSPRIQRIDFDLRIDLQSFQIKQPGSHG
jgi:hypothetical protein